MKNTVSVILIAAILLVVNLISNRLFFRIDLTEEKEYTLSRATKDILRNISDPVTVTAYFSEGLEPTIAKTKEDLREMLTEYNNYSKGNVDFEFISPESEEEKQEAQQNGIGPVLINVRQSDEFKQQEAYMGAVLQMGEQRDVIPIIQPGIAMEYSLSTGIKKISNPDKSSVGIVQGHGEPELYSGLQDALPSLSILYNVENLNLDGAEPIGERFKTIALIAPTDSIPAGHFAKLDAFLARGGKLLVAINRVNADLQSSQGFPVNTGLETWLRDKKIDVPAQFLIDEQCGAIPVQQNLGGFIVNSRVQFPFLPILSSFADHLVTGGLEQVILPFASPVNFLGDSSLVFTPILFTSGRSATITAPTFFDIRNLPSSFTQSNIVAGGVLEGPIVGNTPSKMVIIGDGDFAVTGQGASSNPDNINLLVNGIDWLSDDTGLIDLRTKGVASRPIDPEYLGEEAAGKRSNIKLLNFALPIALIIIYGFWRFNRQRNLRLRRREESYA